MKKVIIIFMLIGINIAYAQNYVWFASSLESQGELSTRLDSLILQFKSDIQNTGKLESYYNFGSSNETVNYIPENKAKIEPNDVIVHFFGIILPVKPKMYELFINYYKIDGCSQWAWVNYDRLIIYADDFEGFRMIYDEIKDKINVFLKEK